MKGMERFLVHAEYETTPRYSANVWRVTAKDCRLMRMVSFYPDSGKVYDTLGNGRYADKDDSNLGHFAKILKQYEGREGWHILDHSQSITEVA